MLDKWDHIDAAALQDGAIAVDVDFVAGAPEGIEALANGVGLAWQKARAYAVGTRAQAQVEARRLKLLALELAFGLNHLAPRHQLDFFARKQAELGAELIRAQERRARVPRLGKKGERLDGHDWVLMRRSKGVCHGVLAHDPRKWKPVSRKDHAKSKTLGLDAIQSDRIML